MSYTGHLKVYSKNKKIQEYMKLENGSSRTANMKHTNYKSYLPSIYAGLPNRIDRYRQFDIMETDPEISTGLNILADFCSQTDPEQTGLPFKIRYHEDVSETETTTIETYLREWCKLNDFNIRIFDIVRNIFKYGDNFFVRDPETYKWIQVEPYNIESVAVDESKGKKPMSYKIKNLDLNLQTLSININNLRNDAYGLTTTAIGLNSSAYSQGQTFSLDPNNQSTQNGMDTEPVDIAADNVIHITLNTDGGPSWPFGTSLLEKLFKAYKQKELIEDSIIIYRIQRAPERLVFKIDTRGLPKHKSAEMLEKVKNEIMQRRIPSKDGGSGMFNTMDSMYNPLSITDNFYFAVDGDGKGSEVTTLPGGTGLDSLPDLTYFKNKLIRALDIPSSYIPMNNEEGTKTYNPKSTELLIQEVRFALKIKRLQRIISKVFNREFKRYLKWKSVSISPEIYDLEFNAAMNFEEMTKLDVETQRGNLFNQMVAKPFISKQYAMKKYLGWTEAEINENIRLWKLENPKKLQNTEIDWNPEEDNRKIVPGLGSVGIPNTKFKSNAAEIEENDFGGNDMGDFGGEEDVIGDSFLGGEGSGNEEEFEPEGK